jgi:hypothetical protein
LLWCTEVIVPPSIIRLHQWHMTSSRYFACRGEKCWGYNIPPPLLGGAWAFWVRCLKSETGEGGLTVPAVVPGSLIDAHPAVVDGLVDLMLEWWGRNRLILLSKTLYQNALLQFLPWLDFGVYQPFQHVFLWLKTQLKGLQCRYLLRVWLALDQVCFDGAFANPSFYALGCFLLELLWCLSLVLFRQSAHSGTGIDRLAAPQNVLELMQQCLCGQRTIVHEMTAQPTFEFSINNTSVHLSVDFLCGFCYMILLGK